MFCRSLIVMLFFLRLVIVLSVLFRFTTSDYPFCIFKLLFCFPLAIVLSVFFLFTASDYLVGIMPLFYCLLYVISFLFLILRQTDLDSIIFFFFGIKMTFIRIISSLCNPSPL